MPGHTGLLVAKTAKVCTGFVNMIKSISILDEKVKEVAHKLEDKADKTEFQAKVKHLKETLEKKANKQELEEVMKEPQMKGVSIVPVSETIKSSVEEVQEYERRKNNLVLFKIDES